MLIVAVDDTTSFVSDSIPETLYRTWERFFKPPNFEVGGRENIVSYALVFVILSDS